MKTIDLEILASNYLSKCLKAEMVVNFIYNCFFDKYYICLKAKFKEHGNFEILEEYDWRYFDMYFFMPPLDVFILYFNAYLNELWG